MHRSHKLQTERVPAQDDVPERLPVTLNEHCGGTVEVVEVINSGGMP